MEVEHRASQQGSGALAAAPGIGKVFRRLVLASLIATYLLIVVGAVVRVTGSGLGCPDWPLCHGSIIPPFELPTLIEYSHRLSASVVSVLVVAVGLVGLLSYRHQRGILTLAVLAVALLLVQVVLGGVTVLTELSPTLVTAHLSAAEALLGTLVILYAASARPGTDGPATRVVSDAQLKRMQRFAIGAATGVFVLVLSGGFVRGSGATFSCLDWPLCQGSLGPSGSLPLIQIAHRYLAALVSIHLLLTVVRGWKLRRSYPSLGRVSVLLGVLFLAQVLVGAIVAWTRASAVSQALHVGLGSLVWGIAVALAAMSVLQARPALMVVNKTR